MMNYKCNMCGEEIEHEPHHTIASCPKCGRRATFVKITTQEEPVDESISEERAPRRKK